MIVLLLILAQFNTEHIEGKCMRAANFQPHYFEARAESLHSFNVLKYELTISVPMTERSLAGTNKIICKSREDGLDEITLHSYTLTIDSVMVDGVTATFAASDDTLHIDLPQVYNTNDSFDVLVSYHGTWSVTSSQVGFLYYPKGYYASVFHAIAYTMSEPWDARQWMPCYDEPSDKADYGCVLSITVPDTFNVAANGNLISEVDNPDTTKTLVYQENYPITTYLMHFAVSRWTDWSEWWHDPHGDSIELPYYVWPEDSVQADTAFKCIPIALALYDSMYGSYPFDRFGQDAVYPFAWGGMEHQEISTIHRGWITGISENGMAHELAHMWWGDMVTCVDFRDIWLNEGFATYSDANYNWHRFGYATFQSTMQGRRNGYFSSDNYNRRPLYNPPVDQIFDYGYTYCKASWLVHMLRYLDVYETGTDTTFFNAIATYRDSFAYGTASTDDLANIFSTVYGRDMTWFVNEWVYGQGYPQYDVYWVCNPSAGDYVFKLELEQIQTDAPPVFHMPVQIRLNMTGSDTLIGIEVDSAYEYREITFSDSVSSINFDPNLWLIEKHKIYLIDTVPPATPHITEAKKSGNHVQLTWTRIETDTLGDPEFMNYYAVYRDTVPDFIPGQSLHNVQHPETTYTDSSALTAGMNYYYLVKAVDRNRHKSTKSNMAYALHKAINENPGTTDKNWTSLPWHSNYNTVDDLVNDLSPNGDPLVKVTNLQNDQLYASYLWDDLFLEWSGTDFSIVGGRAYEMVTLSDTTVVLVGFNEPDSTIALNENPSTTDKNWISIPYNAVYDSVMDITTEYSPSGDPLIKVTNLRDEQLFESYLWDDLFLEWAGPVFPIIPGRGYECVTIADTTWNPTEFDNSDGKQVILAVRSSNIDIRNGSAVSSDRTPLWHLGNGIWHVADGSNADTRESNASRGEGNRNPKAKVQDLTAHRCSHIIRAHVELNDCEDLVFAAYRPDAPYDMLTEKMVGSSIAYKDSLCALWFDVGNFDRPWAPGEEIFIIIEATKNGHGYWASLSARLDETVDIQDLATVSLIAIPKPTTACAVAQWEESDREHVIGYSLYKNDVRINDEIIVDPRYTVARDASLRLVFAGGIETVYSSHGTQSGAAFETPLHYAFNVLSNPSIHQIRMTYTLKEQIPVTITIYDICGRQLKVFDPGSQAAGHYTLLWDGSDDQGRRIPAGVYFVRFEAQAYTAREKILLLR